MTSPLSSWGEFNGAGHGDMESAAPFPRAHNPGDDYRTNVQRGARLNLPLVHKIRQVIGGVHGFSADIFRLRCA